MFVIRLFSRSFVVQEIEEKFIVREAAKYVTPSQEIEVNIIDLTNALPVHRKGIVVATTCLKNKIITHKFKRRKRYHLTKNYQQTTVYFQLTKII